METTPYLKLQGDAMLIILEEDQNMRCCALNKKIKWTFGRETKDNHPDIPVSSRIVGRTHGEFACVDNKWVYVDKGSINGTYHNGIKIHQTTYLSNRDVLRIDADDLNNPDERGVWIMFLTEQVSDRWVTHRLDDKCITIGRSKKNNIVLNEAYISSEHCVITNEKGKYYIEDCASTAGTWLNQQQISQKQLLKEKDVISICDRHFVFVNGALIYNEFDRLNRLNQSNSNSCEREVLLKADIVRKQVKNTNGPGKIDLIRNIHLEVERGKLVALIGGSGAGKSTLMDCLNGMDTKGVEGTILFKGEDLIKNFPRLKYLIASVPQLATFHSTLTVEQELMNSAQKRLPSDMTKAEISERLDQLIKQLGLELKRKTKIGKCSGGEQRRVNIAMDLIATKLLYCLDEPDAGLDPGSKKELFTFLKKMAHEDGKTIIVIFHDASMLQYFDQVIMLAKKDDVGRLAYAGDPQNIESYFGCEIGQAYDLLSKCPEQYIK